MAAKKKTQQSEGPNVTPDQVEELKKLINPTGPVLHVKKFGASWCGPCKAMASARVLENLAAVTGASIQEIDADAQEEMSDEFQIESFPTMLFFAAKDGEEIGRKEGGIDLKTALRLYKMAQDKIGG